MPDLNEQGNHLIRVMTRQPAEPVGNPWFVLGAPVGLLIIVLLVMLVW